MMEVAALATPYRERLKVGDRVRWTRYYTEQEGTVYQVKPNEIVIRWTPMHEAVGISVSKGYHKYARVSPHRVEKV